MTWRESGPTSWVICVRSGHAWRPCVRRSSCGRAGFTQVRSLGEGSVGAVSAIHLLEHLPFQDVVKLSDETVRVLRPGGVATFETPNPENLVVGACSFYLDPTHRNPIHTQTL